MLTGSAVQNPAVGPLSGVPAAGIRRPHNARP